MLFENKNCLIEDGKGMKVLNDKDVNLNDIRSLKKFQVEAIQQVFF